MNDQEFRELLQKYRDEPASVLAFQPSIELLIDSHHCQAINSFLHQPGILWERKKAVDSLGNSLPDSPGLYMFVWRPELTLRFANTETERFGWVVYIGKAGTEEGRRDTIKQRYVSEYSKFVGKDPSCLWDTSPVEDRESRLARYLTLRPLEYWFLTMQDVREIQLLEKRLIKLLRPPLNLQHGVKLRPGKTVPAFEEPK